MDELLLPNWRVLAWRGALAILFALIAFFVPHAALTGLVLIFAAYLACDGGFAILAGWRRHPGGGLIVEGMLDLVAAALLVLWPALGLLLFVYATAAWAVLSGAALLAAGWRLHRRHGHRLLLLAGGISVLWGVLVVLWPMAGLLVWAWWMGAYALAFGIAMLSLAFRLRPRAA